MIFYLENRRFRNIPYALKNIDNVHFYTFLISVETQFRLITKLPTKFIRIKFLKSFMNHI